VTNADLFEVQKFHLLRWRRHLRTIATMTENNQVGMAIVAQCDKDPGTRAVFTVGLQAAPKMIEECRAIADRADAYLRAGRAVSKDEFTALVIRVKRQAALCQALCEELSPIATD
jgi:hypothetical protein